MMAVADPTLEVERTLHDQGARYVIGCDEVGRGAIAGPVAVGLCVVDSVLIQAGVEGMPAGLRDSKMLPEPRRELLAPLAAQWVLHSAVGLASAEEVDRIGIIACLGLAAKRALTLLHESGARVAESVVLLDGSHNWLSPVLSSPLRVQTRVKADRDCASVAAASVIAKVHRDRLMIDRDAVTPGYGWASNKGYGSADHYAAIDELGPSDIHRLSWLHSRELVPAE